MNFPREIFVERIRSNPILSVLQNSRHLVKGESSCIRALSELSRLQNSICFRRSSMSRYDYFRPQNDEKTGGFTVVFGSEDPKTRTGKALVIRFQENLIFFNNHYPRARMSRLSMAYAFDPTLIT